MKLSKKHFYNTADFTQKEINSLVDLALAMKKEKLIKVYLENHWQCYFLTLL